MEEKTKSIVNTLFFIAFLLVLGFAVPQTLGLSSRSFNEAGILSQYQFYVMATGLSALGIIILFFVNFYKRDDEKYGNSILFFSPGEFPSPKIKFFKSAIMLFLVSLIVYSFLFGILPKFSQQTFFGADVPSLKEQFTSTENISYSNLMVPIAENFTMAFILAFFVTSLRFYAKKKDLSLLNFRLILISMMIVLFVITAVLNHARYNDSDQALISVALFWALGAVVTFVTGSFIPFWIQHVMNNVFIDIAKYYPLSNVGFIVSISTIVISAFFLILLYRGRKNKL